LWGLARALAERGHEVRFLYPAVGPGPIALTDGVWVHGLGPGDAGSLPLDLTPDVRLRLAHSAAVHMEVQRLHHDRPIDVVCAPLTGLAGLHCLLDDHLTTVLSLDGAASPDTPLERLAVQSARFLLSPTGDARDEVCVVAPGEEAHEETARRVLEFLARVVHLRRAA
jgi:hypothetical protein